MTDARSAAARGYDAAWSRVRLVVLDRDGWTCQVCGDLADQVDHVIPLAAGGARLDPSNLRACCRSCNVARTHGPGTVRAGRPSRRW